MVVLDISFFPEGGNLPEGIMSRVAFKAVNINGYPETVTGKMIDEKVIEITSVETFYAGMKRQVFSRYVTLPFFYAKILNHNRTICGLS